MISIANNKVISIHELWQFFNRSATLFCISGSDGYLKQVNPHVVHLLGFTEENILSTPFFQFIHPDDLAWSIQQSKRVRSETPVVQFQNRVLTASGNYKWISWNATYIGSEDNVYLIGQDHTDTHLVEDKLKKEKRSRQKSVLKASLVAQEKEREQIGRELHDNINQMLATVLLYHQMAISERDQSEEMIKKGTEIVKQTIAEIRCLSKVLVGPDIKGMSLTECIKDLIEPVQQGTSLNIILNRSNNVENISAEMKLTIFRIIQEQLNNIIKHAEANKVNISLENTGECLLLKIMDDGKGFDTSAKKSGIGLHNMRSRVDLFNGNFHIEAANGQGCTLSIMLPNTTAPCKKISE